MISVDAMADPEKKPAVEPFSNGDEEGHAGAKSGTVTELDDLTVLGYKPELQRNRSMFTLLFQSLAIAAVSGDEAMTTVRSVFAVFNVCADKNWY